MTPTSSLQPSRKTPYNLQTTKDFPLSIKQQPISRRSALRSPAGRLYDLNLRSAITLHKSYLASNFAITWVLAFLEDCANMIVHVFERSLASIGPVSLVINGQSARIDVLFQGLSSANIQDIG